MSHIRNIDFSPELQFRTSRSGGKGGQNVNKVETRVELVFNPQESSLLTDEEKSLIVQKLAHRINSAGTIIITAEEDRSQLRNRGHAIRKFYDLLEFALKVPKKRKKTKPSKASVEKRLQGKKRHSQIKANRRMDFE